MQGDITFAQFFVLIEYLARSPLHTAVSGILADIHNLRIDDLLSCRDDDLPPGQEGVADGEVSLDGKRHGAVDAAHEPDLRHGDHDGLRRDEEGLRVLRPEVVQREQVDRARHVDLQE